MLLSWFPEGIQVVQSRDPGTTGNFEITVDGELVHSKKTKGQGFLEPKSDKDRLVEVKAAINAKVTDSENSTGDMTSGKVEAGGCVIS
mmetsp:Transcript_845/g.1958  ORF Transcript_845/g.1958 Transcript_845/m.1958 type:complete len:88 (+) Transcript_845:160-423(+)